MARMGSIVRAAIAMSLASAVGLAFAEAPVSELAPSGYVTASAYAAPSSDGDKLAATGLRGAFQLDGLLFGAADFRVTGELYSNLAGLGDGKDYDADSYAPLAWGVKWNDRTSFDADLKEAWVSLAAGDFDFVAGKQIIAWGQADGTNPTDNINPRYVGTRSVSSTSEKKLGVPALNAVYNIPSGKGSVQGVFLPMAVTNRMPSMGTVVEVEKPEFAPGNFGGGGRVTLYPGAASVSASYLTILDPYPFSVVRWNKITRPAMPPMPPRPPITISMPVLGHTRLQIIGCDAVYPVAGFDLRTEWAYTLTEDAKGSDPDVKNPYLSGVVQASRTYFDGTTVFTLSWAPSYILGFEKPAPSSSMMAMLNVGQGYEFENMAGFRVQSKLMNETLQLEAMFLGAFAARDWYSSAGVTYNLADGWNLKTGVNLFGSFRKDSDADRQYGTFGNDSTKDSDAIFVELRFDF